MDQRTRADKLRDMAKGGTPPEQAIARRKLADMGEPVVPPLPRVEPVFRPRRPPGAGRTYVEDLEFEQARWQTTRRAWAAFDEELKSAREKVREEQREAQARHRTEREAHARDQEELERLLRSAGTKPGGGRQTFELDPDTGDFRPIDRPAMRYDPDLSINDFFEFMNRPRFTVTYSAAHGRPIEVKRRW